MLAPPFTWVSSMRSRKGRPDPDLSAREVYAIRPREQMHRQVRHEDWSSTPQN